METNPFLHTATDTPIYGSHISSDTTNMSTPNHYRSPTKKLQKTTTQVNEVITIMKDNVENIIDRDVQMSNLENRAESLHQRAEQFETKAAVLKKKFWWEETKIWVILGLVGVSCVLVFYVSSNSVDRRGGEVMKWRNWNEEYGGLKPAPKGWVAGPGPIGSGPAFGPGPAKIGTYPPKTQTYQKLPKMNAFINSQTPSAPKNVVKQVNVSEYKTISDPSGIEIIKMNEKVLDESNGKKYLG